MRAFCTLLLLFALLLSTGPQQASAQDGFDAGWFSARTPYLKVGVVEDGIYYLTGAAVQAAGLDLAALATDRVTLLENGRPVPLLVLGGAGATLAPTDTLVFVGRRHTGRDEAWAYDTPLSQSSPYYSLFSDTTYYWLYAGDAPGPRYAPLPDAAPGTPTRATLRDTVHVENDTQQYDGDSDDSGNPLYTRGEGRFGHRFFLTAAGTQEATFLLKLPHFVRDDSVFARSRLSAGSSAIETSTRHLVTLLAEQYVGGALQFAPHDVADWSGYAFADVQARLAASDVVASGDFRVRLRHDNTFGGNPNIVFVDYFDVAYTRRLQATGGQDQFAVGSGEARLALAGYGTGDAFALAPALGAYRQGAARADSFFVGARFGAATRVFTSRRDALRAPARVARYAAPALASTPGADYLIVTTPLLRPSAEALAAEKQAGGLTTLIVEQQDVFAQFGYGQPSPLAIRRLVHQSQAWTRAPRFALFWGDALTLARTRPLQPWEAITFGNAASDGWYAMQYGGPSDWSEVVAVGRLPIRTNDDGMRYVGKLRAYAAAPPGAWQVNGLHASGGFAASEVATLESYVRAWAAQAAAPPVALDTTVLVKRTLNTVDNLYREQITEEMRQGLAWYAFFGHSGTQFTEILLDAPSVIRNAPRLPAIFTFGCRTGAFTIGSPTENSLSFAELFVVSSEHGAIAHWGSSENTTIGSAGFLGRELHRLVFDDTVRVLGLATQEAKRRLAVLATGGGSNVKNLLEYSLIGDPAVRLRLAARPNLHVEAADIRFSSDDPVVADSLLDVRVTVRSWGLVPSDSVDVALYRTAPGAAPLALRRRVAPFADSLALVFTVKLDDASAGENAFEVAVDEGNRFDEEDETDNRARRLLPILSGEIALVAPGDYAFAASGATLRLTRSSLARDTVAVTFEVDTTAAFASPARQRFETQAVTFAQWTPPGLAPGQPYFWRARIEGAGAPWTASAFTPGADTTGWAQSGALLTSARADAIAYRDGGWFFKPVQRHVQLTAERGSGLFRGLMSVDDRSYNVLTLGWAFVVMDGVTGAVKAAVAAPTYKMSADLTARFGTEAVARARLDSLVQTLETGDVVLGRSRFLGNSSGPTITDDVKGYVRALGSVAVDTIDYRFLWQMMARVGYPDQRREWVVAPGGTNEFVTDSVMTFRASEGRLTSLPIGPAQAWQSARADVALDGETAAWLEVWNADATALLAEADANGAARLSEVSPGEHPRLRLIYHVADTHPYRPGVDDAGRAPARVPTRWQVAFTPVADLLLDGAVFAAPTAVQEGEAFTATVPVRNLGTAPAPGAVVQFTLIDAQNRETEVGADTLGTIAAGATAPATITFGTTGLVGRNSLRVRVEQPAPEPVTFNNFYRHTFSVGEDATPPTYTITIDGEAFPNDPSPVTQVQNPAFPFVAARPTIEITIEDENTFRPLGDSTVVELSLNGRPISLRDPAVQFEPAAAGQKTARLVFTPDLTGRDTTYTLVLRAFDATGNEAAGSPYQVHFRVQNTLEVESVLPYPNPMVGATTFAFRVKGADAGGIRECRLRIYTLTGQPVREFDLVENPALLDAGALRVGWNKLRWDGTDADGDRLATGVYLYRVFIRGEGGRLGSSDVERLAIIR